VVVPDCLALHDDEVLDQQIEPKRGLEIDPLVEDGDRDLRFCFESRLPKLDRKGSLLHRLQEARTAQNRVWTSMRLRGSGD